MIKYFLIGVNMSLLMNIPFIIFLDFKIASKNIVLITFSISILSFSLYYLIKSEYIH
jgi:hypothetical protein